MSNIKRIILDVLKPHTPSILEMAELLGNLDGISGVNISLEEVDKDTDSVKITIEGNNISYDKVNDVICELAVVDSVHVQVDRGRRVTRVTVPSHIVDQIVVNRQVAPVWSAGGTVGVDSRRVAVGAI